MSDTTLTAAIRQLTLASDTSDPVERYALMRGAYTLLAVHLLPEARASKVAYNFQLNNEKKKDEIN